MQAVDPSRAVSPPSRRYDVVGDLSSGQVQLPAARSMKKSSLGKRCRSLYVNYFQPSFKLMEKMRKGSVVTKRYSPPATPCERVLQYEMVGAEAKASLNERRARLDPVALLHSIQETQSALAAIVAPEVRSTPRSESLERFLARLPDWWRQDEEGASRPKKVRAPRT